MRLNSNIMRMTDTEVLADHCSKVLDRRVDPDKIEIVSVETTPDPRYAVVNFKLMGELLTLRVYRVIAQHLFSSTPKVYAPMASNTLGVCDALKEMGYNITEKDVFVTDIQPGVLGNVTIVFRNDSLRFTGVLVVELVDLPVSNQHILSRETMELSPTGMLPPTKPLANWHVPHLECRYAKAYLTSEVGGKRLFKQGDRIGIDTPPLHLSPTNVNGVHFKTMGAREVEFNLHAAVIEDVVDFTYDKIEVNQMTVRLSEFCKNYMGNITILF